jgi:cytochrome c1
MKASRDSRHGFMKGPGILLAACFAVAGCATGQSPPAYSISAGGNANVGKALIVSKGCGGCHVIPGVYTARGLVGPPLYFFSRRTMIAGELPNTADNLVRWIKDPKQVEPGTAMPDLGLSDQQARDVAAYLYTLK